MLAKIVNRIRNGYMVYHNTVSFEEVRFCTEILDILREENFIGGYTKTKEGQIEVLLRYPEGSQGCTKLVVLSRPRHRLYLSSLDLYRVSQKFGILGVLIVSTPKGIMTSEKAVLKGLGGEMLVYAS
uniref:ribosomal protein S8 n=1 Tax=Scytothamnus australis TaxID=66621 RepID=UPI002E7A4FFE|nr:ribosomal protein S8 [Scytothamnus australis]WBP70288.1 ribosomal protein S8 [Scytothamnus australis]